MGSTNFVLEFHYGGRFDRSFGCEYVGGKVAIHKDIVDPDKLSYFDLEDICKGYGYQSGDLMYFKDPVKSLVDGLYLITSDHDVLYLCSCHRGHSIVQLYIVSFLNDGDEGDSEGDDDGDEEDVVRVYLNDPFWADKLSDNEDLFEVEVDDGNSGAGPSNKYGNTASVECETQTGQSHEEDGNGEDAEHGSDGNHEEEGNSEDDEHGGNDNVGVDVGDDANYNSDEVEDDEMARSDILESPVPSDEDGEITSFCSDEFHAVDIVDPVLTLKMKFANIQLFREAVKQFNLRRGKDIQFKKNERRRCVVVCRDPKCQYRVYARQLADEESFQIISLNPKHVCGRKYKNSIVSSTWIANKLIDKFRVQPNMPLDVLQHEVKDKWKVDVTQSMMYRARKKAKDHIYGSMGDQYERLWDYCEAVRRTNVGSRMFIKVDRPSMSVNPKFQRLYVSLAATKKGFLDGCRPVIGVDGCFLKGPFKGQLLSAVGRDGNNNMYPIAFAVVEAETKDSWVWFLETLIADLGSHEKHGRPTFISDRQKVIYI